MTGDFDPADGTAYRLLDRDVDDGPGKTMIISNMEDWSRSHRPFTR